jgi:hypothetical protein
MRTPMVLTSHDLLGNTGRRKTASGLRSSQLLILFSTMRGSRAAQKQLSQTVKLADVKSEDYDNRHRHQRVVRSMCS